MQWHTAMTKIKGKIKVDLLRIHGLGMALKKISGTVINTRFLIEASTAYYVECDSQALFIQFSEILSNGLKEKIFLFDSRQEAEDALDSLLKDD